MQSSSVVAERCSHAADVATSVPGAASSGCDANVEIYVDGCGLEGEQSLIGLTLHGQHPSSMEVRIERDDAELTRHSFLPRYDEDCGCTFAEETISVE
jgi:hypothetical protein